MGDLSRHDMMMYIGAVVILGGAAGFALGGRYLNRDMRRLSKEAGRVFPHAPARAASTTTSGAAIPRTGPLASGSAPTVADEAASQASKESAAARQRRQDDEDDDAKLNLK
jgi:hypothetical protein